MAEARTSSTEHLSRPPARTSDEADSIHVLQSTVIEPAWSVPEKSWDDTASLGSPASHGCIRMSIPEVKELWRRVAVKTSVFIS